MGYLLSGLIERHCSLARSMIPSGLRVSIAPPTEMRACVKGHESKGCVNKLGLSLSRDLKTTFGLHEYVMFDSRLEPTWSSTNLSFLLMCQQVFFCGEGGGGDMPFCFQCHASLYGIPKLGHGPMNLDPPFKDTQI